MGALHDSQVNDRHRGLLAVAAERLGLDRQAPDTAARAALSAPTAR